MKLSCRNNQTTYTSEASIANVEFEIIFENGVPMVKVTNPWGAGASKPQMITMTIEEFMQNFRSLFIAEIP